MSEFKAPQISHFRPHFGTLALTAPRTPLPPQPWLATRACLTALSGSFLAAHTASTPMCKATRVKPPPLCRSTQPPYVNRSCLFPLLLFLWCLAFCCLQVPSHLLLWPLVKACWSRGFGLVNANGPGHVTWHYFPLSFSSLQSGVGKHAGTKWLGNLVPTLSTNPLPSQLPCVRVAIFASWSFRPLRKLRSCHRGTLWSPIIPS